MKKRLMCLCLVLSMVFGIFVTAPATRAASDMKASDACIDLIKRFEGFSGKPYVDSDGLYTIGYGTRCPEELVEKYMNTPMTEEEAEVELRKTVATYENAVNKFMDKHKLIYEQHQFDAIISLVFNCGSSWLNKGSTLIKALIGEATGNELIYAFTIYSMSNGNRSLGHVRRRLAEASLYLSGQYLRPAPDNIGYVLYDPMGGKISACGGTYNVQGYDALLTAKPVATASRTGYLFLGWFTEAKGGQQITRLDESTLNTTLYAHWAVDPNYVPPTTVPPETEPEISEPSEPSASTNPSEEPSVPEITEPSVEPSAPGVKLPITVTVTGSSVNVREQPGTAYDSVDAVYRDDQVVITEIFIGDDYVWGKIQSGWIALKYTNFDMSLLEPSEPAEEPSVPEVTEPSQEPTIPEVTEPSQEPTIPEVTEPSEPVVVTKVYGTIINTNSQNVRETPDGEVCGVLHLGDRFEIYEQLMVDGRLWGRCDLGWVCIRTNVRLETVTEEIPTVTEPSEPSEEPTIPEVIEPSEESTIPEVTEPSEEPTIPEVTEPSEEPTIPEVTEPSQEPTTPSEPETVTKVYGTIIKTDSLNVRDVPDGNKVAVLYKGDRVEILEQQMVDGRLWGRCELGWICIRTYVQLETVEEIVLPTEPSEPSEPSEPDVPTTVTKVYGTIIKTDSLNVRATPDGDKVGVLYKGDCVEILEQQMVDGRLWGRCTLGWICMRSYVQLEEVTETIVPSEPSEEPMVPSEPPEPSEEPVVPSEPSEPSEEPTIPSEPSEPATVTKIYGTIIKTDSLNVRRTPDGDKVAVLYMGDCVEILEQKLVDGRLWGRCDMGWICMRSYVQLETVEIPVTESEPVEMTVTASALRVRVGTGTDYEIVDMVYEGEKVLIYEIVEVDNQRWARVVNGWVSMAYLV